MPKKGGASLYHLCPVHLSWSPGHSQILTASAATSVLSHRYSAWRTSYLGPESTELDFLLLRIGGGSATPPGILTKRKALGQGRVGPHFGNTAVKAFLADFEVSCAKAAIVRAAALQTSKASRTAESQHSARARAEDTVLKEIGMGEALIPGTLPQDGSVPAWASSLPQVGAGPQ